MKHKNVVSKDCVLIVGNESFRKFVSSVIYFIKSNILKKDLCIVSYNSCEQLIESITVYKSIVLLVCDSFDSLDQIRRLYSKDILVITNRVSQEQQECAERNNILIINRKIKQTDILEEMVRVLISNFFLVLSPWEYQKFLSEVFVDLQLGNYKEYFTIIDIDFLSILTKKSRENCMAMICSLTLYGQNMLSFIKDLKSDRDFGQIPLLVLVDENNISEIEKLRNLGVCWSVMDRNSIMEALSKIIKKK